MFKNAFSFNQNLSAWDVSKVADMRNMFDGASRFNQDLSSWIVGNIEYSYEIFRNCNIKEEYKPKFYKKLIVKIYRHLNRKSAMQTSSVLPNNKKEAMAKVRVLYFIPRVHSSMSKNDLARELRAHMTRLATGDDNPVHLDFCCVEWIEYKKVNEHFNRATVFHCPMSTADAEKTQHLNERWSKNYPTSWNIVERINHYILRNKVVMGKPIKVRSANSPYFWMLLPTTTQMLLYEINDMEDSIMHTYLNFVTYDLRSKDNQAMVDEIKNRYVKHIKVDETSFTAATEKELVKKLKDRLKDLTRLNKIVYNKIVPEDDIYELYT